MSKWQTEDFGQYIEVVPLNDTRPHLAGDECWCNPEVERTAGSRPLITHNQSEMKAMNTTNDELDTILDTLSEYDDVDRTLTIEDKLAYYPELKKAKQALTAYITKVEEQSYKRGFKEAENYYRTEWVTGEIINELKAVLANVPMPTSSYEQVQNRITELNQQLKEQE